MLTQFDAFLIVFFLMCAVLALGAIGMYLDNILDPKCNCTTKRTQEEHSRGVKL